MHHRAEVILHPAGRGQEPAVAVGEIRALRGRKYVLPTNVRGGGLRVGVGL